MSSKQIDFSRKAAYTICYQSINTQIQIFLSLDLSTIT